MGRTRKVDKAAKVRYDQVCHTIDILKGNFPWLGTAPEVDGVRLAADMNALYHRLQVRRRYAEDRGEVRPRKETSSIL